MPKNKKLPLGEARHKLALLWFPPCGFLFLFLVIQSLNGAYGSETTSAWGWALPNFLPTLALMISVFAASALQENQEYEPQVKRAFYVMAFGLSAFYLLVIYVIVFWPVLSGLINGTPPTTTDRLSSMELSSVFLGPLQSLVVATLGVLFFLKDEPSE